MSTIRLTEVAWAAGFLDGEGCFYLSKHRDGAPETRTVTLKATQVRTEPLDRLQRLFGGVVIERKTRTSTGKRAFDWQIKTAQAKPVLEEVLPHLSVKGDVARAMLQYIGTLRPYGSGSYRLTEEERVVRRVAIAAYDEAKAYRA